MKRINKSQYALLGCLSKKAMSGYDIKNLMQVLASFHWNEANSQIYPMLKKLESEGMVNSELDQKSGGRQRRLYHITQQGLTALQTWLQQTPSQSTYREELLLKLSFGPQLANNTMITHLESYLKDLEKQQQLLKARQQHIATDHQGRPDQAYLEMVYDYAEETINAKIRWAKRSKAKLLAWES